ncbi:MAG: ABC transporter permease [Actinobacteria bacterium]|nr:ABC transporter permease [Actinomycetota bacterium]
MRFRDLSFLVVSNLRRMKLRLALTSLGVVIGTAAIVLMLSLGIGLQANMTASLGDLGAATHINVMGGGMGPMGTEGVVLNDEMVEQFGAIEHVEAVLPSTYVFSIQDVRYRRYQAYLNTMGVPMDAFEKFGYELEEGRLPRNNKEILLGAVIPTSFSFASDDLFMGGTTPTAPELDLLGKRLTAKVVTYPTEDEYKSDPNAPAKEEKRKFTVVGILAPSDMQTDQTAYVTMDAAIDLNDLDKRKVSYENVIVKADSVNSVAEVEQTIMDMGFYTFSARSIQDQLKSVFLIIQGVLGALGAIAMLVAALGITNTMTMSIYERTREIGIMKAVGASNRQIKRVFLGEAAIIGMLGGTGGLLFSAAGAALANLFVQALIASQTATTGGVSTETTSFFQIPVWLAIFAIAFAAGVGLLAGVLPAVRAANLDPLTALRHE